MHRNARLTPAGRLLLCQRIEAGWPLAHAAESMHLAGSDLGGGATRPRASPVWKTAPGRPRRTPTRTKSSTERRIVTALEARSRTGPHRWHRQRHRRSCYPLEHRRTAPSEALPRQAPSQSKPPLLCRYSTNELLGAEDEVRLVKATQ